MSKPTPDQNKKKSINPAVEFLRNKNQRTKRVIQVKPIQFHGSRHRG